MQCDLCHSRKIKCDRKEPCANCTTAGSECLRTRHKRVTRTKPRKDDKIQALIEKLSTLENVMSQGVGARATTFEDANTNVQPPIDAEVDLRPPKRRFDGGAVVNHASKEAATPADSEASKGSQTSRPNEGMSYIQDELSHNNSLADNQRSVLELAIAFIDQLSQTSSSTVLHEVWNEKVPVDFTQNELLQVLVASKLQSCCVAIFDTDWTRSVR